MSAGEFPGSLFYPGESFTPGRRGYPIRYVVVHGTGWPQTLDQYITEYKNMGVTYMIGRDGRVVQFVREADMHWGNGKVEQGCDPLWREWTTTDSGAMSIPGVVNPNLLSVSIEHEKHDKANSDQLTEAQSKSSFAVVKYLCIKYNIPARRASGQIGGIVPHSSMEPVTRSYCPGPYPWDELFRYLGPVPGWTDTGDSLIPQES